MNILTLRPALIRRAATLEQSDNYNESELDASAHDWLITRPQRAQNAIALGLAQ
jgi:hypothetical protein